MGFRFCFDSNGSSEWKLAFSNRVLTGLLPSRSKRFRSRRLDRFFPEKEKHYYFGRKCGVENSESRQCQATFPLTFNFFHNIAKFLSRTTFSFSMILLQEASYMSTFPSLKNRFSEPSKLTKKIFFFVSEWRENNLYWYTLNRENLFFSC